MAEIITPQKTDLGWVMEVPPSAELQADFERLFNKYAATFEKLKCLGD